MRIIPFCASMAVAASLGVTLAAPPGEVPADASFVPDRQTLAWSAVPDATGYDVYRGTNPAAYDQACRVYRTAGTSAVLSENPASGAMFYFLIAAVNADGSGILGTDGAGNPVPNTRPCVDSDGDLVADNLDNCASVANPAQADQDGNGVGDACDPRTYDFEADPVGARPAQMTSIGPAAQTLTVKSVEGEHAVSFDQAGAGTSERFERVPAGMPLQDTTVYVDFSETAQFASLELWSDGAYGWNAGNGVILQMGDDGTLKFYDRHAQDVPGQQGPLLPPNGRMRIRLLKGTGAASVLHVDSWDGAAWNDDYATFPVADDHRYLGLGTVLADYFGGPRPIKRITVIHAAPPEALRLRKDWSGVTDWKLFQRDALDRATIPVRFYYRLVDAGKVQARVVRTSNGAPLAGFDWPDHEAELAPADGAEGSIDLASVPTGGNYDVQVRLVRAADGAVLGQGAIVQIAVGDVFLAGGQSNMSGYSGTLDNAETPVDEVHLFHNDYNWKRASEPMDDGTDQVDRVSAESPAHTLLLRFAKEIWQATGVPVGIIPGPLGGTNLYSQWQRNEAIHDDRGTLYGSLLYRARVQRYTTPPKGFLWYQGESDAGRGTDLYKTDMKRLMAEYREDLGNPNLVFGIVQLATYDGADFNTWVPIQEAHREVVEEDPYSVLAVAIDQPRADVIHLNVEGYKTVGLRMANEMREHVYGQAIDASARLTKATVIGNGRRIDLTYDRAIAGGVAALFRVYEAGAPVPVNSVSASGNVLTLSLGGRVGTGATVSYGYAKSPAAAWVKDTAGTAVAVFQNYPTTP